MAAVRHLEFCDVHVWTTQEGHLVVFVTVQNLVGIDAVVLTIWQVLTICKLGLKMPIHAPKLTFLGAI